MNINFRSFRAPAWSLLLWLPLAARATPTENLGIRVLPVPGTVSVDGRGDDWDLSGGIFACDDVQTQRDSMGVWFHAMYDAENLYLLAHFLDATPMNNPGQTIADYGFAGDSLQLRTITGAEGPQERGQHFTAWHGQDGKDVITVEQGKDFKEGVVQDAKKEQGAQQAFLKDPEGRGYVQEIAIPWKLLTRDGHGLGAGDSLRLTIEPNFTVGTKGRFSIKDIFKSGLTPDRVFTFMSSKCWGVATLEAHGRVAPAAVRLADAREFPVKLEARGLVADWDGLIKTEEIAGFKPVEFDMPFDGYVSLNITNTGNAVARQLLTCAPFSKGRHSVKWDGLGTWSWTRPGEPLPPGDYHWSAVAHTGLGLRLRGWAANSGKSPWDSDDGKGNWGGDHGVPVAVAADDSQVYLGWNGAEAGKSVLATDTDGRVLWSNNRAGICGVKSLAAADGVLCVLGGNTGADADGGNLYKLDSRNGSYLPWDGQENADLKVASVWGTEAQGKPRKADAVAVTGGRLYLTFSKEQIVAVIGLGDGKLVKTLPMADRPALGAGPRTTSKDGSILTWKGEPENQIIVSQEGREIRRMGRPGGRALLGPWQADGLRFVSGMAMDTAGKLWVAEADGAPKRVSVWDPASGRLLREFFGSTGYGALGGAISPQDPDVMIGQGCEWRLDPQLGQARCTGVVTREGMENSRFAVGANGKLYLAVAEKWAFEAGPVRIFERVGEGQYRPRCSFRYEGKGRSAKTTLWTDANGDGQEQPEEMQVADENLRFSAWFMNMGPDLTITADDRNFRPTGFTACGSPIYDLRNPVKLPAPGLCSADGSLVLQPGNYGETHTALNCYDIVSGEKLWSYPDNFNGVHGSHNACPPVGGMIRGSYGICGAVKLPGAVGNLFVIPTNVGEWHLLTGDGFYLSKLFQGDPLKMKWPAEAVPGADVSECPPGMGGEDFGGSVCLGQDGKLYLQAGKTAYWNLAVTGLESVTRLAGGKLSLDAQDMQTAKNFRDGQLQAAAGRKRLAVARAPVVFTGNLDTDFKGQEIAAFQKQEDTAVRTAAAWDDANIYLAWDVQDRTPWVNGATAPEFLYLGGDTVDFQMGSDSSADPQRREAVSGDLRLSIGDYQGSPAVVVYRPVSQEKAPKTFSSGVVKSYVVENVRVLTDAIVKVTTRRDGYVVEAAIPLAELGLKTGARTLRGDFGVTYGDTAGKRTRLRNYWSNQQTGLVDDAVFELQLQPGNWGELNFR